MQHAGGMLLIAGLRGDNTLQFAFGKLATSPFEVAHPAGMDIEFFEGAPREITRLYILSLRQKSKIFATSLIRGRLCMIILLLKKPRKIASCAVSFT